MFFKFPDFRFSELTLLHSDQVYEYKGNTIRFSFTCTQYIPCGTPLITKLLLYHHGRVPAMAQFPAEAMNSRGTQAKVKHTKELFPRSSIILETIVSCASTMGKRRMQEIFVCFGTAPSLSSVPLQIRQRSPFFSKKLITSPIAHYIRACGPKNGAPSRRRGLRRHSKSGYSTT